EDWSHLIRGCLLWLGEEDPRRAPAEVEAGDPRRALTIELLNAWFAVFGESEKTAPEVVESAAERAEDSETLRDLACVLRAVCGESDGRLNPLALGHWLRRIRNR